MDYYCLKPKTDFEMEISCAMAQSVIFLAVISREAINSDLKMYQNFNNLVETSRPDQLLSDYRLAIELRKRGVLSAIYPLFVGSILCSPEGEHLSKYSFVDTYNEGLPTLSSHPAFKRCSEFVVVKSTHEKVDRTLRSMERSGLLVSVFEVSAELESQILVQEQVASKCYKFGSTDKVTKDSSDLPPVLNRRR